MLQVLDPPVLISDFRWTLAKYHEAIAAGVLGPEDKIELLNGQIVNKMSINPPHAATVAKLNKYFSRRFLDVYELRSENPVTFIDDSEPEPDYTICALDAEEYAHRHPRPEEVHLIVEVAENSLSRDRTHKAKIYASAGIAEYWIVNLKNRQLEIHVDPDPEAGVYGRITRYKADATGESPFVGEVVVADLLPAEA